MDMQRVDYGNYLATVVRTELGAVYKIVAIEKDELVVSAPNSVRTTVAR